MRSIPTFDESRALMVHCGDLDLVFNAVVRTTSNEEEQEALAEKMDGMNRLASFLQVPRPENSNLTFHHLGMYDTDSREALLFIIVNCDP